MTASLFVGRESRCCLGSARSHLRFDHNKAGIKMNDRGSVAELKVSKVG